MEKGEVDTVNRHILLVEADEVLGQVMRELLEREGYDISRAGSSTEALRLIQAASCGAMIVDLDTVPAGDLLMNIVNSRRLLPRSVVYVSVQQPEVSGLDSMALWLRQPEQRPHWVRKPFRNEDFLAVVRGILPKNSQAVANGAQTTNDEMVRYNPEIQPG